MSEVFQTLTPLAYTISQTCVLSHLSRTTVYDAIKKKELRAVKRGRRTLVLAEDLRHWLEGMPSLVSSFSTRWQSLTQTAGQGGGQ